MVAPNTVSGKIKMVAPNTVSGKIKMVAPNSFSGGISKKHLDKLMTESTKNTTEILFICMGNICRSPSAEAVMQALVKNRND